MRKILFRFDVYEELGMGHYFRCSQLMEQCDGMSCIAAISAKSFMYKDLLEKNNIQYITINQEIDLFDYIKNEKVDIIVNDILNTSENYMQRLRKFGCRIVNLEDEGDGARLADVVINELYEKKNTKEPFYYGKDYYCLPPNMLDIVKSTFRKDVKKVILLFGGTDPSKLTEKSLQAVNILENVRGVCFYVVIGPGNNRIDSITKEANENILGRQIKVVRGGDLTKILMESDLAVCSQGRTMFELAHARIPAIIMAQNEREHLHTFANFTNGFLNLGYGKDVNVKQLNRAMDLFIHNANIRKELYTNMARLHLEHGINRVKKLIIGE